MKAIVQTKYGSPDVLKLQEVEKPTPKDDEVLVKVGAASVNDWDWGLLRGKPFMVRLLGDGLLKPKKKILGADIAGRVEAVGKNVEQFQSGDEVFGDISGCGWGGFAEFVSARENALAPKPANLTFEEAAAVPQASILALQGLRRKDELKAGQKVLINGAGGGAGSFAVQIAKSLGAEVTGVDSARKLDMMRLIGADHVIDYVEEDFTKNGQRYDLILDMAAHRSIFDYRRSLSSQGIYVMEGGSATRILQGALLGPLISMTGDKKMGLLMHRPNKDLDFIIELLVTDRVVPVVDRRYPLSEAADALRYFGAGNARGKVVITVDHDINV